MASILAVLQQISQYFKMSERRPWTPEEDCLLRQVFQTSHLRKWSHIARRLQEEHGIRGRNGKQCRERYLTAIDCSLLQEEWTYAEQQQMMDLHNQLGNKWAIIGNKIGNRTDNAVKNHFYSRLRKGLRKVNLALQKGFTLVKEFKPNVLYRIVEVAEESFKSSPNCPKQFSLYSNQLKNDLFEFAYDDEVEGEQSGETEQEQARELIDRLFEFTIHYKRKSKKQRKDSANSQYSQISNLQDKTSLSKRPRRCSEETSTNFIVSEGIRTRAFSHLDLSSIPSVEDPSVKIVEEEKSMEKALDGLHVISVEAIMPAHPLTLRKQSSCFLRLEEEEFRFFEDSQAEMRLLPEMDFGFRKDSQMEENIFI